MDKELLFLINTGFQSEYLDIIFIFLTVKGYLLFIPFIIYTCFKIKDKKEIGLLLTVFVVSFALTDWFSNELKGVFLRLRPCIVESGLRDVFGCSSTFSMPSNHAGNSMSAAFILFLYSLRLRAGLLVMIVPVCIALLISISRVYLGVHYPSDVAVGMLLGAIVSSVVITSFDAIKRYYTQKPIETMLILMSVALFLFRIYYIRHGGLDLSPDEAHYWEWSRRLDLSYYSKGPLIAYLIKLSTFILGDTNTGVRIFAPLMLTISGLFMYSLTYKIVSDIKTHEPQHKKEYLAKLSGMFAAISLHLTPLYAVYGIVFTIDTPFLLLWVIALYQFLKISEDKSNKRQWLLLGVVVGLGLLAKYTMVFFILCVGIYLIVCNRKALLTPYPYMAVLISLVFFLPVILFNYKHDWVTIKHTLGQANVHEGMTVDLRYFFEFLGSQIGILSGVFFVLMIYALIKIKNYIDKKTLIYILSFSLPIFVFFLIKSLQGKVQANWAMPAYIIAIIPMAYIVSMSKIGLINKVFFDLFKAGVVISILISFVGLYPHFSQLPVNLDPSSRLRGWAMLAQEVDKIRDTLPKDSRWLIFSDAYQISSELAFYLVDKPEVYCINLNRRMNQYDLWESPNAVLDRIRAGKGRVNAIYVTNALTHPETKELFDSTGEIAQRCEKSTKHIISVSHKNRTLRNYAVLICYNLSSLPKNEFRTF